MFRSPRLAGWPALVVSFALTACPRNDEGEGPTCEDIATVVGVDDVTPLGFPARALLELAVTPSPFTGDLSLAGGGTTAFTLTVEVPGEARFIDSEAVYPDGGVSPAIAIECQDRVEVDVAGGFDTADGAFAEDFPALLVATAAEETALHASLDPDTLQGSYDARAAVDEPDIATIAVVIDASFDENGSSGLVHTVANGEPQCDGDVCSAWGADIEVGTW